MLVVEILCLNFNTIGPFLIFKTYRIDIVDASLEHFAVECRLPLKESCQHNDMFYYSSNQYFFFHLLISLIAEYQFTVSRQLAQGRSNSHLHSLWLGGFPNSQTVFLHNSILNKATDVFYTKIGFNKSAISEKLSYTYRYYKIIREIQDVTH